MKPSPDPSYLFLYCALIGHNHLIMHEAKKSGIKSRAITIRISPAPPPAAPPPFGTPRRKTYRTPAPGRPARRGGQNQRSRYPPDRWSQSFDSSVAYAPGRRPPSYRRRNTAGLPAGIWGSSPPPAGSARGRPASW